MATRLKEVDAVIVGLGWTGGILAKELAEAGLKVVALERGAMRSTEKDYAVPNICLLYTSPSPRDGLLSRMPSSA